MEIKIDNAQNNNLQQDEKNYGAGDTVHINEKNSYKVNKNGYVQINLNLNPNDREDYKILEILSNLEGKSKIDFIREAILSNSNADNSLDNKIKEAISNNDSISSSLERKIRDISRTDTEKYITQKSFEKKIQPYINELIDIKVDKIKEHYDSQIQMLLDLLNR